MKRLLIALLALLTFILFINKGYAQSSKAATEAEKYFSIKNYEQALPLFLEAIKSGDKDPVTHYKTGVCYQKSTDLSEQSKAIGYFEYALKNGAKLPSSIYFELGGLYLRNEDLQKAIEAYTKFKELSAADKKAVATAERAIAMCHNAVAFMSVPRQVKVNSFGFGVNTKYTEYNPVVSADESILAFTALRPNTGKTRSGDKFIEEVYISYNTSGTWSQPVVVPITSDYNVGTAGISADGQKMMIFMGGATDPGNIFVINRTGDTWSKPSIFASTLNSKHLETTSSITPDGKTIYFASDRLGGMGGMDIYKIELQANGNWSQPINLGPAVNTKDNEDAPFIHPDQKTLFFTSDGHSTMGGRDIFMTKNINGSWTRPENMGYPINTTANDNYFTLIADGTRAYFSSDRKGGQGAQDIYYIDMPEDAGNIPLTMIKGRILNADTGKPMPTKIYVIDNQTNKKLDFVYDPDPLTGNYLIILPPAKNYDVIIESEGFLPYTINVNVPNQDYFYELFQQINLKTIKQFDVVVGQEVQVKNAFYNTNQDSKADLRKTHEAKLAQSGNVDIYDMMMDLLAAGDDEGVDYVLELIHLTNTMDKVNFDDSNPNLEVATRVYYYDETDESKFEKKQVDGNTILSLPTFEVAAEAKKQKNQTAKKSAAYDKTVLAKQVKVYFDVAKSDLKTQYNAQLDEILALLKKYPELSVEISGFASQEGSEEMNRDLSNKRAIEVLNYLNHRGIVRRRIVAKGYGATKTETSKEEGRRVEVRIIDVQAAGSI
ncbi:MAG: PD40 domain-containing protein [Cyclobacteriaceae bacterium]|nr:PD40 domain-containing protein [Cyclobacteriaceae bacterium]